MIRINLLPPEFRVQKKESTSIPIIKIGIAAAGLFVVFTIFLYIDFLQASARLASLKKQWGPVSAEAHELNQLKSEVEGSLKEEKDFMEQFVTAPRSLTLLLTWSSEYLPETAWLTEVKMELKKGAGSYLLRGLAFSSDTRSSIEYIEEYLHQMKEKIPDADLSLTTTRQIIDEKELTQFTAIFRWGIERK